MLSEPVLASIPVPQSVRWDLDTYDNLIKYVCLCILPISNTYNKYKGQGEVLSDDKIN
jgi:hypothetical protein